jgi:hypothetical protein
MEVFTQVGFIHRTQNGHSLASSVPASVGQRRVSLPENYLTLSREERLEPLGVAATQSGRPVHLLEKDIWVVWALDGLSGSQFGEHLVLGGGTSLSKDYNIIRRLSKDIDVIYDIRQLVRDRGGDDPIPTREITEKVLALVESEMLSIVKKHIEKTSVRASATAVGRKIYVDYDPLAKSTGRVQPRVIIEFTARSIGESSEKRSITCDVAAHLPNLRFPSARPNTMLPKRIFWEKATALHVYCARGANLRFPSTTPNIMLPKGAFWEKARPLYAYCALGDCYSRHWHDLMRLDDAGYAKAAFEDPGLAKSVAAFKARFHRAEDSAGNPIDYDNAVSGNLKLVPDGETLKALEANYKKMADDGILLDDAEPFAKLIERCTDIEKRANSR